MPKVETPQPTEKQATELAMLDSMAEFAARLDDHGAYHFIRAWAHDHGYHVTSCTGGAKVTTEAERDTIVGEAALRELGLRPEAGHAQG